MSEEAARTPAPKSLAERFSAALKVFLERRVLIVLFLGFSSGLPLALSGSTLTLWMADIGVDIRAIGLYALVGVPYTLKFLWAPIVDALRVPVLGRLLGHRRAWMLVAQALLMAAILFLGSLDPLSAPLMVAGGAVLVAIASATQDIVIDAFRVESLKTEEQAAGMAYFIATYRVGLLVATAGVIGLVAYLEHIGIAADKVWFYGYASMAVLVVIGTGAALAAVEPGGVGAEARDAALGAEGNPVARLAVTAYQAFADFLTKDWAIAILLFVILFKLCDTFAGIMTGPFVLAIGFDKAAYAAIVKGVGLAASLSGGIVGGLVARALPFGQALWIAGLLQMASNLVFSWQALVGANHAALTLTITIENFTGAIGTVIFVAYLSGLCKSPLHTATQFALLTALSAVGRTTLASLSGFLAASSGWFWFFALSALAAIPGLALLWWLDRQGHFAALVKERGEAG
ncbi:MAG: MFS transporter [Hyphomicrobiales bacterium]|nr:MFS transporter [Hyphomicrobiales bacterium]